MPRALAQEIRKAMKPLPREALGLDPGAVGGAAPLRLVHARGDRQAAAVMGVTPAYLRVGRELLRPLPPRAAGQARGAGLHQHLLLAARRRRHARRVLERPESPPAPLGGRRGLRPRLRVPRRLRPGADGLDRRALLRPAGADGDATAMRSSSCAPARTCCRRSASRTAARPAASAHPADRASTREQADPPGRSEPEGEARDEGRRSRRGSGADATQPPRRGCCSATSTSRG